jgi:hypothetical protein
MAGSQVINTPLVAFISPVVGERSCSWVEFLLFLFVFWLQNEKRRGKEIAERTRLSSKESGTGVEGPSRTTNQTTKDAGTRGTAPFYSN